MSRYYSYLNSATRVIDSYQGKEPLAVFLKQFFSQEKKFGSRDRKQISELCYHYYRVIAGLEGESTTEKLLAGAFLCQAKPAALLIDIRPEWAHKSAWSLPEKMAFLKSFDPGKLFLFPQSLSPGIDSMAFGLSFLVQPKLFLRCRPGFEKTVPAKLTAVAIGFIQFTAHCLALENGSRVEDEIQLDREAVVQDFSSQRVGEVIEPYLKSAKKGVEIWDCCAASGGKSIMLKDLKADIGLTVSDIRESILHNLRNRFQRAGIGHYRSFTADLSESPDVPVDDYYDMILADVPCSGSGTWARTPEQMHFFTGQMLAGYAERQRKILSNIVTHLKPSSLLVYITCSVFAAENEEQVAFVQDYLDCSLVSSKLLIGYDVQADSMFVAIFTKN